MVLGAAEGAFFRIRQKSKVLPPGIKIPYLFSKIWGIKPCVLGQLPAQVIPSIHPPYIPLKFQVDIEISYISCMALCVPPQRRLHSSKRQVVLAVDHSFMDHVQSQPVPTG